MTTDVRSRARPVLRKDLIEPELSYRIVGCLFAVYNELGPGHAERLYQRALAAEFLRQGLAFREQVAVPVDLHKKIIGRHFLDFLVEERIVVELKRQRQIYQRHYDQVVAYLSALNLPLAIIANFGPEELAFRRVINVAMVDSQHS